ncbi:FMN-dependent NADH-azoreductase [Candidatus Deianiraea vastatrix]|uniref:FMN dependent NADH:quinone oxidoreductase n=1 Tax=Candidatus Deianiraea vastatrix TaxID=2163644 RepID=A0A5B8XEW2_9RICK|nr:NAD(P)H-dependent oxidoreductase [Candidatus Deianiraea vastatrix]QED22954.1 FMN-dependent NADH-azoreductase [Candidatus Deianiraea vastatrix]
MKILYITSSPMGEKSNSRAVASKLLDALKAKGATITERDLAKNPVPHINIDNINAFRTPSEQRDEKAKLVLKLADELIEEIKNCDMVVFASPMWNFGVPSVMKAYIDHIVRAGVTFKYTETGPVGLLDAKKKAIIISSSGGIYSQGDFKSFDHQSTYLESVLQFLGLKDIKSVHVEGMNYGEDAANKGMEAANAKIDEILKAIN